MSAVPEPLLLRKYLLLSTFVREPAATIADAAVLSALVERFNDTTGAAWPSLSTLARDCGRDRRTVQRSLQRLVRAGLVTVTQHGTRTASNHYAPRFEAGVPMHLGRGADAPTGRGVDAPTGRGADAPTGRGVDAPLTHTTEPVRVQGEGANVVVPPPALPRSGVTPPPPAGIDAAEWTRLFSARPELNPSDIVEQVEYHRAEGCPVEALNRAVVGLRLNRGHRSLSPNYRRARPAKTPKPPAKEKPSKAPAPAPAPAPAEAPGLRLVWGRADRIKFKAHPVQREFRRINLGPVATPQEREDLRQRLQREFPSHYPAVVARPSFGPELVASAGEIESMLRVIAEATQQIKFRRRAAGA